VGHLRLAVPQLTASRRRRGGRKKKVWRILLAGWNEAFPFSLKVTPTAVNLLWALKKMREIW
jgi:hypothetical protein